MSIKEKTGKLSGLIKKLFADDMANKYVRNGNGMKTETMETAEREIMERERAHMLKYENRREQIGESSEPVEGVFYIYNGQIIPDYFSECLLSDRDNPLREHMYHSDFFRNYMRIKYMRMGYDEKSIPRGRIENESFGLIVKIDKCFYQNIDVLKQLFELYRLPEGITVSPHPMYRCPDCRGNAQFY